MLPFSFFFFSQDAAFPTAFRTRPPSHHPLCSKIPTFFPSFHLPPRSCFSAPWPLFICCTVLPNLSLSLPSPLHSPPTIFTDFSNMSFRRLLPPVSWGRRGELLELLVGKLVELSSTFYYNEATNNGSSCVSVLPLLLRNSSWTPLPSTVSSCCCKNTHSHQRWASAEPRCRERNLGTKKSGWYCNCEWIVPLNWLSEQCNNNKSLCNTVKILIKMHQSQYACMFVFSHSPLSLMNCNTIWCQPLRDSSEGTAA